MNATRSSSDLSAYDAAPPREMLLSNAREHARRMRVALRHFRLPDAEVGGELPEKHPGSLRLVTLNMAHGRKHSRHQILLQPRQLHNHLDDIASVVHGLGADVLALQEADGPSAWSGNFDHVAFLAERAGLQAHYRGEHNQFRLGRFRLASGTALLARLPFAETHSHRFGLSWRDTKGFVKATLRVPKWNNAEIDMVSLHLDFLQGETRRRQIRRLIESVARRRRPLVVLGDLNCSWHLEPDSMRLLLRELGVRAWKPRSFSPTWPAHRPRLRLDWILISEELDFRSYRTIDTPLSDHLAVTADLVAR